ncbi:alpha/beta hydrolase [Streptomyces sp. NPDC026673]|uniref:alpha/beta fold hydrolase n=1 Tax=Streptomyces sp. NPDC026673 TaxID=3155724 RepID=UPI00340C33B7
MGHTVLATPLGDVALHRLGTPATGAPRTPVLLLHANPGDSRDYGAVAAGLAAEREVFALDWPGYGRSTATAPASVTPEALADIAERALEAIARSGAPRAYVIGNSVGGWVAVRLAERRPARIAGIVLVDPAGFTRHTPVTRWFCRAVMGRPSRARRLLAPLARAYLGRLRTTSARATYDRARRVPADATRLAVHCALWRAFAAPGFALTDALPGIVPPVLLLWGRRDPLLPVPTDGRRARRSLPPGAVYATLPAAHEAYNERPDLFLARVRPFLTE